MTIKFKKFVEFVSMTDEPTDEQINELFGIFKNNEKADKAKAAREKLKADTAKKVADWRAKKDGKDEGDDLYDQSIKAKNFQARTTTTASPRAAAAGRSAERDWTGNLATESADDANYSEVEFKMDKYMHDDEDVIREYHHLMDERDREGLIDFFQNEADIETMQHYGGPGFTLEGFVDWLLENR